MKLKRAKRAELVVDCFCLISLFVMSLRAVVYAFMDWPLPVWMVSLAAAWAFGFGFFAIARQMRGVDEA